MDRIELNQRATAIAGRAQRWWWGGACLEVDLLDDAGRLVHLHQRLHLRLHYVTHDYENHMT